MSPATGKSNKIHTIVSIRQMLCRWRKRATTSSPSSSSSIKLTSNDVPAGHVAIYVGTTRRRFIVRATYLNHPVFKKLLSEAEEEYGFCNTGPLHIPCEELEFENILQFVSRHDHNMSYKSVGFVNLEEFQRFCHVGNVAESKPLLHGSVY